MTCYLSRGNWHSYVKNDLSEKELLEMSTHLLHCPECKDIVTDIQMTDKIYGKSRSNLNPPPDLKIKVMNSIDINKYKSVKRSHLYDLKNWGLSFVATGAVLFALNLTSWTPNLEHNQVAELNSKLGKQIALPFEKMGLVTQDALRKINLKVSKDNLPRVEF